MGFDAKNKGPPDNVVMRLVWRKFTEIAPAALVLETKNALVAKGAPIVDLAPLDVEALKQASKKFGAGSAEQQFASKILGRLAEERPSTVGSALLLESLQLAVAVTTPPKSLETTPVTIEQHAAPTSAEDTIALPPSEPGRLRWQPRDYTLPAWIWIDPLCHYSGELGVSLTIATDGGVEVIGPNSETWRLSPPLTFTHAIDRSSFGGVEHRLTFHNPKHTVEVVVLGRDAPTWVPYDPPPESVTTLGRQILDENGATRAAAAQRKASRSWLAKLAGSGVEKLFDLFG